MCCELRVVFYGPVAHLVERSIRIAEVRSSSLLRSTKNYHLLRVLQLVDGRL